MQAPALSPLMRNLVTKRTELLERETEGVGGRGGSFECKQPI